MLGNQLFSIRFAMRQINFVIIFIFCLALALFAIENPEPATIQIVPGVEVQGAIAVELILAVGLGAVLAWMFSVWTHWQRLLSSRLQLRQKNAQIQELQSKIEEYQTEIQTLKPALPPVSDSVT